MTAGDSVTASIDVAVEPGVAFEVFTGEIDAWYVRNRYTLPDFQRTVAVRFEPWPGGRLMDVYDDASGEGREMGRVVAWEPGRRLLFTDLRDTEVEVTFEPAGTGTRVTLEHRGLERVHPDEVDHVREYGWRLLLQWFNAHVDKAQSSASKGREQP